MKRPSRLAFVLLCLVLGAGGVHYAGLADADDGSSEEPVKAVAFGGDDKESEVESSVELMAVPGADLRRARPALLAADGDAFRDVRKAGRIAVPYPHSSHYLAFMIAHLIDEEVLPDRDWDLGQAVYELRGDRLTTIIPREGVVMDALRPERHDILELRREFHGGGALDDPNAEEGLLAAIRVLRKNFERLDEGGALVAGF
jgi:hypothetical protein